MTASAIRRYLRASAQGQAVVAIEIAVGRVAGDPILLGHLHLRVAWQAHAFREIAAEHRGTFVGGLDDVVLSVTVSTGRIVPLTSGQTHAMHTGHVIGLDRGMTGSRTAGRGNVGFIYRGLGIRCAQNLVSGMAIATHRSLEISR